MVTSSPTAATGLSSPVAAVSASHIWKRYEASDVLRDVSVEFFPGEIHAIVGENGAGKSTLVKILAGETQPSRGEVRVRGDLVHLRSPADSIELGVACVYQELTLLDNLSVPENVLLGVEPRRLAGLIDRSRLVEYARDRLTAFGIRRADQEAGVDNLPVGLQTLVEVAKWGSRASSILILDEPTSALRTEEAELLFDAIRALRDSQVAVIYISHRLEEVVRLADVVTVLRDGKVAGRLRGTDIDEPSLISMMVGADWSRKGRVDSRARSEASEPGLTVSSLSGHRFRNVSLNVRSGTILGIAGQVGSGVEELAETIAGWRKASSGEVKCGGRRVASGSIRKARASGIVFLPADRKVDGLAQNRTAQENISAGALGRCRRFGLLSTRKERDLVLSAAMSARVQPDLLKRDTLRMSGGQQQKVLLAQCLAAEPEVLVVVEPTRGVDIGARQEIHATLRELCSARDMAVVVASSDSAELCELCDEVAVMREGRVVEIIDVRELTREELLSAMAGARHSAPSAQTGSEPAVEAQAPAESRQETRTGHPPGRHGTQPFREAARHLFRLHGRRGLALPALLGTIAIAIVLSFSSPYFLTGSNLGDLGRQVVVLVLASMGEMLVILLAGIDLSIGAVITLANLVSSALLLQFNPAIAVPATLAVGAASGTVCGLLVIVGLPSFLVTYAVGLVEGGVALIWFANSVGPVPRSFWRLASASVGGVPIATIALLVFVVVLFVFLRSTRLGRHFFATGRDIVAARRSGLSVRWSVFLPYVASGLLAAAAGIFLTARVGGGLPGSGTDVTLDAIAAVMLGGASFFGGRVSVVGTLFGAIVLTLVGNGLALLHVNGFLNDVVLGSIVLLVVGGWSIARQPKLGDRLI